MKTTEYRKLITAAAGGALTAALGIWGPDTTVGTVLLIVAAVGTALGVYKIPNAGFVRVGTAPETSEPIR